MFARVRVIAEVVTRRKDIAEGAKVGVFLKLIFVAV